MATKIQEVATSRMCTRLARDLEYLAVAEAAQDLQPESEHAHLYEIAAHWAQVADELERKELLP